MFEEIFILQKGESEVLLSHTRKSFFITQISSQNYVSAI